MAITQLYHPTITAAECGLGHSNYRIAPTEYYDRDGNVEVIREHWAITNGRLHNFGDPDIWLSEGPDRILFVIDPVTGISALSGLALHLNVPGYGIIAIDAGRAILTEDWEPLWLRGPHMFFEGELDPVCEFFASN